MRFPVALHPVKDVLDRAVREAACWNEHPDRHGPRRIALLVNELEARLADGDNRNGVAGPGDADEASDCYDRGEHSYRHGLSLYHMAVSEIRNLPLWNNTWQRRSAQDCRSFTVCHKPRL